MLTFESDYTQGCHPAILEKMMQTNFEMYSGYGEDPITASAREKIKAACNCPDADIWFLSGGTQTNQIVIDSLLRPWEGVVAATTGHIACHEAGAIEYTGNKVLTVPGYEGKMKAADLDTLITDFYNDSAHEHMVFPGAAYISHPTEYGTLYTKEELTQIHDVCQKHNIPLFMDGARLGYGLMAQNTDVTLEDITRLTDVFYIGGTKVGALCGEAVVYTHHNMPPHFVNLVKKHGALLAKGRLNAIQFVVLFTDNLYFDISKNAIELAMFLKEQLKNKGYQLFKDSPTNQQFVVLENSKMEELKKHVGFNFWEKYDENHTVVRFATSWATTREQIDTLLSYL